MKRACAAVAVVLALAMVAAAQSRPNFSGTWVLDVGKSNFGGAPPLVSMSHEIQHKDPTVTVTTRQKSAQGELTNERTITTDGKENRNRIKTMAGDQDVKSTSAWDGGQLKTTMKVDVQGTPVSIEDVWGLSLDGKVLTITRHSMAAGEAITQTLLFNKQ